MCSFEKHEILSKRFSFFVVGLRVRAIATAESEWAF